MNFQLIDPYGDRNNFLDQIIALTQFHYDNCSLYKNIVDNLYGTCVAQCVEDLPYLPSSIFKYLDLYSIPDDDIKLLMYSSGTSGKNRSKIYVDRETLEMQRIALLNILMHTISPNRLPILFVDTKEILSGEKSARQISIMGIMNLASINLFMLDCDEDEIRNFVKSVNGQFLVYGMTDLVWGWLVDVGIDCNFSNAILLHGGGWKRIENDGISRTEFCHILKKRYGFRKIYNFYGMIEQTGGIYVTCENDNFHVPIYSDIIIRDKNSFEVCDIGQAGLIQSLSVLPKSYCGHSILTEDIGVLLGNNGCGCGKSGKYFNVIGRSDNSELRGCANVR